MAKTPGIFVDLDQLSNWDTKTDLRYVQTF